MKELEQLNQFTPIVQIVIIVCTTVLMIVLATFIYKIWTDE